MRWYVVFEVIIMIVISHILVYVTFMPNRCHMLFVYDIFQTDPTAVYTGTCQKLQQ